MEDEIKSVLEYHERSKHHPNRLAPSLGYLDWANQPDPFRSYEGAPRIDLPLPGKDDESPAWEVVWRESISSHPLDIYSLSGLLFDSLALSAWKVSGGARWSLRVNPSSGNLHPTESYLLLPPVPEVCDIPSLFHYAPEHHALEFRHPLSRDGWDEVSANLPEGSFLLALTTIYWREAWKYGERAFRYCQHDLGHALACVALAAAAQGWEIHLLDPLPSNVFVRLLSLEQGDDDPEREVCECLLLLRPAGHSLECEKVSELQGGLAKLASSAAEPYQQPNRLSRTHHAWPVIQLIDRLTETTRISLESSRISAPLVVRDGAISDHSGPEARKLFRSRRSAVAMDANTSLKAEQFFQILQRCRDSFRLPWEPAVSLACFVHRVEELPSGLYILSRGSQEEPLRSELDGSFDWSRPDGCPSSLPLYRLQSGDFRQVSGLISCRQSIASDGVAAFAMLAEVHPRLSKHGPWFYRRLYWEAGMIGQLLYLEAEIQGIRATGIGCYFDDLIHELLKLRSSHFQSLYHFTIGGGLEDPRLQSLPAYDHLQR